MLGFIDKKIEKILKKAMRKRRDTIFQKTLNDYIAKHNPDEETIAALTKKLEDDIDRVMTLADRSVIHANMLRARYVFWITAIIGTAIAVALAVYPITTSIVPFFVPLMAAFVGWAVAVGTIPVSYIHTVKGVMDAAVATFEKEQHEELSKNPDEQLDPAKIDELKKMADELQKKINELSEQAAHQGRRAASDLDVPPPSLTGFGLWHSNKRADEGAGLLAANPEIAHLSVTRAKNHV